MHHTWFPLLLTSPITVAHLLQLMTQCWYSFVTNVYTSFRWFSPSSDPLSVPGCHGVFRLHVSSGFSWLWPFQTFFVWQSWQFWGVLVANSFLGYNFGWFGYYQLLTKTRPQSLGCPILRLGKTPTMGKDLGLNTPFCRTTFIFILKIF